MPSGSENASSTDEYDQPELPLFGDSPKPLETKPSPSSRPGAFPSRHFIGWDRPVLDLVVEHLADSWSGKDALDLSNCLILVPTRNAGRLLREKLALHASQYNAAVIPPLVTSPEFVTAPARLEVFPSDLPITNSRTSLLIWSSFLLDLPLEKFRAIFPIAPVERDMNWAMGTARDLLHIRNLLTESNHDFSSASQILAEKGMEPLRWKELARLEKQAIQFTGSVDYQDEFLARNIAEGTGNFPPEIKQILVTSIPDISHQAAKALLRHHQTIPVEILIHAPADLTDQFDDWGRPIPDHWLEREIAIPDAEEVIHQAANATEQAELVGRLLENQTKPAGVSSIGIPDAEVAAPVAEILAAKDWTTHDPSGQAVSTHGIFYLLQQTRKLLAEESFSAFQCLLRCPDFSNALIADSKETDLTATSLLNHFDELAKRCLPDRLHDARSAAKRSFSKTPELAAALDWTEQWMARIKKGPFEDALIDYLSAIFANRTFRKNDKAKSDFTDVAKAILQILEELSDSENFFRQTLRCAEKLELLLELLGESQIYADRTARDIDLQGWLELPWDDAPHLIITGINDHLIPESLVGHAFLPDSARGLLDIQTNDTRFARDAFLLTGMIESRRNSGGRVDLIFGRQSNSGDPLRPSRLLFQCSDDELPARILQFFSGENSRHQTHPWKLPWKLQPMALPDDHKIYHRFSVTAFRSYLVCPFRFYLSHGLGMRDLDIGKTEMDAMEFGNLIHNVLEDFGNDSTAKQSVDEKEIADFFQQSLDARLDRIYGSRLTTPVMIQQKSAQQRLRWWAKLEAEQRREGWSIEEIECEIATKETPFCLGGTEIHGRIDRIEKHPQQGYRIIDFKTGGVFDSQRKKNKQVDEYHLTPIKRTESADDFPEWTHVTDSNGKACRWTDLQIPLYVLAMKQRYPDQAISAGHINIGPTQGEVQISLWDQLGEDTLESARSCAENIIEAVQKENRFWPPSEKVTYDDFEEILFGNALESVATM